MDSTNAFKVEIQTSKAMQRGSVAPMAIAFLLQHRLDLCVVLCFYCSPIPLCLLVRLDFISMQIKIGKENDHKD